MLTINFGIATERNFTDQLTFFLPTRQRRGIGDSYENGTVYIRHFLLFVEVVFFEEKCRT